MILITFYNMLYTMVSNMRLYFRNNEMGNKHNAPENGIVYGYGF